MQEHCESALKIAPIRVWIGLYDDDKAFPVCMSHKTCLEHRRMISLWTGGKMCAGVQGLWKKLRGELWTWSLAFLYSLSVIM